MKSSTAVVNALKYLESLIADELKIADTKIMILLTGVVLLNVSVALNYAQNIKTFIESTDSLFFIWAIFIAIAFNLVVVIMSAISLIMALIATKCNSTIAETVQDKQNFSLDNIATFKGPSLLNALRDNHQQAELTENNLDAFELAIARRVVSSANMLAAKKKAINSTLRGYLLLALAMVSPFIVVLGSWFSMSLM